jgi:imidazole glycerol-phosphate synthase subunit HisH
MIGIIDYGSGNLMSVFNAFKYLGETVKVYENASDMTGVDKVVLPGVGALSDAKDGLAKGGFIDLISSHIAKDKPFLGICLGLQLLFSYGEESGGIDCLGLVKGGVKLFSGGGSDKVPQIGWNTVAQKDPDCPLFRGIKDNTYFYFVHSYYCDSEEPEFTAGVTNYGLEYTSVFWKGNTFAVQFHPERSQKSGLKMLENFIKI